MLKVNRRARERKNDDVYSPLFFPKIFALFSSCVSPGARSGGCGDAVIIYQLLQALCIHLQHYIKDYKKV